MSNLKARFEIVKQRVHADFSPQLLRTAQTSMSLSTAECGSEVDKSNPGRIIACETFAAEFSGAPRGIGPNCYLRTGE